MSMKTVAYDYDKQRWITGDAATAELRRQWEDTLELLRSARGEEYARFLGRDKAELVAEIEAGLASL